ncbi:MAG: hypothetical protein MUF50_03640 [Planctomycetes bacterium]|nr:hypothetical protein [Planctomycetota bacterium]
MKKEKIFIIIALAVVLVIIVLAALFSGKNNKQNPEINNQTSVNNLETIIKKEKKIKISAETISEYCRFYQKDIKQIKDAIKFYPEEMQKEMNDFQKMMKELK